ncbi:glycosyltransferase [bacterium]|nr:glycosyltransferase [bacterium]
MIENLLQIYLLIYNRKNKLKETLKYILDIQSPIRNFDITILDNASDDVTSELIEDYIIRFPNIN